MDYTMVLSFVKAESVIVCDVIKTPFGVRWCGENVVKTPFGATDDVMRDHVEISDRLTGAELVIF